MWFTRSLWILWWDWQLSVDWWNLNPSYQVNNIYQRYLDIAYSFLCVPNYDIIYHTENEIQIHWSHCGSFWMDQWTTNGQKQLKQFLAWSVGWTFIQEKNCMFQETCKWFLKPQVLKRYNNMKIKYWMILLVI